MAADTAMGLQYDIAMKPLFIPLKTEHFRAFADGSKTTEYRAYGPRWNEKTCIPGRPAIISHGYSGQRLFASVIRLRVLTNNAPAVARQLFGDVPIAAIDLRILD